MRWTVEGADKLTGREITLAVEAENKAQAERIAGQRGLLVSSCYMLESVAAVDRLDELISAKLAEPEPPPPSGPMTQAIDYRRPSAEHQDAPEYVGLLFGAKAFRALGVTWIATIVYVIVVNFILATGAVTSTQNEISITAIISCVVAACVFFAAASGCDALRDMARNSFAK